jgi:hypothetical protein
MAVLGGRKEERQRAIVHGDDNKNGWRAGVIDMGLHSDGVPMVVRVTYIQCISPSILLWHLFTVVLFLLCVVDLGGTSSCIASFVLFHACRQLLVELFLHLARGLAERCEVGDLVRSGCRCWSREFLSMRKGLVGWRIVSRGEEVVLLLSSRAVC